MENIAEYPLLFVEDYSRTHDMIMDIINQETSLPTCTRGDDDTDEPAEQRGGDERADGERRGEDEDGRADLDRTGVG